MPADLKVGREYALVWRYAATGLGAVGLVAALVFIPVSTVLMVFLVVAGVVGSLHLNVALGVETLSGLLLVEVLKWAVRAALVVVAVCGYVASVGPAAFVLVLLVGATSPPAVRWLLPHNEQVLPHEPGRPRDLAVLSDEELCREWKQSYAAVRDSQTGVHLQAAVEARRRYLDELERRKPEAFSRWLESMPHAATDPSLYYLRASDRNPPEPD